MLITPRQIRAARGLLGWDYADLCKHTDFHRHTIRNIESGHTQAQPGTMNRIAQVFGAAGVEFLEHDGVRLKPANVDMLTGQEGLRQFFDHVYDHVRQHGGTIMQFGVDEQTFLTHLGSDYSEQYLRRMAELSQQRADLKVLAIICEGDTNFLASAYNQYRWISKDIFQAVPFYLCGDTLAIMDFQTEPGPTVMLLNSRTITSAYRKQFEAFWKMARTPPVPPAGKQARKGKSK